MTKPKAERMAIRTGRKKRLRELRKWFKYAAHARAEKRKRR